MQRSEKESHVGILSVASSDESKKLKGRILDRAMDLLGKEIAYNLRKGDSFTKCSASQYILLLPTANYENSCMVCERIIKAFNRKYPHSPVKIEYTVQGVQAQI